MHLAQDRGRAALLHALQKFHQLGQFHLLHDARSLGGFHALEDACEALLADFVLLVGPGGDSWYEAATRANASLETKVMVYRIGPTADLRDLENGWTEKFGASFEGAVLVRPDGFVAWRTNTLPTGAEPQLEQVLARILCRSTVPDLR